MVDEREDVGAQAGTLRDFLAILFKHKAKILVILFSVVATVTVGSFVLPPTYEAKSSALVKFGRENLYRPEVGDKGPAISFGQEQNQEQLLNSEIEILTSRDLMGKVVDSIGYEKLYPDLVGKTYANRVTPNDVAIVRFGKKLSVRDVKKSNVINVGFQHKDPYLAAQAVNLLLDYWKEKHLQVYSDPKSSFLEKQLGDYRQKLARSEDALQGFKQSRGVYSLDEQRNLLLRQRIELDTAYKGTQNNIQSLRQKLASLKSQARMVAEDGNTFAFSEQGNILTDAKAKLLDLQLKEHGLLIRYKEDSPPVKDVRKEIRMTKDFLATQEREVASKVRTGNLVYQETEKERIRTEADLHAQEARLASLGPQIARLDGELKNLDRQEKKYQELKREAATNEANYQVYVQRYEEARISDDMNRKRMSNLSIIQAAAIPTEPVKPRKQLNIALSIVLGAISSLGAAFFSEYLGHTFNTAQDAERRLGLPVLASITGLHA
jgi:uncharacterized protein involved in exopolysaccharide biosynthesis